MSRRGKHAKSSASNVFVIIAALVVMVCMGLVFWKFDKIFSWPKKEEPSKEAGLTVEPENWQVGYLADFNKGVTLLDKYCYPIGSTVRGKEVE